MKKAISITLVLLLGIFVGISAADVEKTVFGPENYSAKKKKDHKDTFSTAALNDATIVLGKLIVMNGGPDKKGKKQRVKDATIKINGKKVLEPKDFNKKDYRIEIAVKLQKENTISVKIKGKKKSYITVQIDYEVGPGGPIFSGPQQYPFVCRTEKSDLGQPLVDNHEGFGIPVYGEDASGDKPAEVSGYCKDCNTFSRVDYFYRSNVDGYFYFLGDPSTPPADIDQTTTSDGLTVDYIVRLERVTINRFIYSIAMLAPFDHDAKHHKKKKKKDEISWDTTAWNGKLIYSFDGGVAIGHDQGKLKLEDALYDDALSMGFAVAYSTGNRTGVHYNLMLGGETAIMVKDHFVDRYGKPKYTVSVGGSGGAIQGYVYGQNHPGLLDATITAYSYSDMVTQTIYVGDCSLLEYYFDVIAPMQGDLTFGGFAFNPYLFPPIQHIGSILPRTWIEGLSSSDTIEHPIYFPMTGQLGSTECIEGWFGLTPLAMNPLFTDVGGLDQFPDDVVLGVKWNHWNDLKNIYGVDENGYAPAPMDNVGVQYGLQALKDGNITIGQFLDINAKIGGWKQSDEMIPEGYPFSPENEIQHLVDGPPDPADFDPWSIRNANIALDAFGVAPRTAGNIGAMNAAYESGMVFTGEIDIPVIDFRHYLDPVLDMHHAQQSFATRQRMIDGQGHADNQLIWFAEPYYDMTIQAFSVLDEWLYNIKHKVLGEGTVANKPATAVDLCVNVDGHLLGAGPKAWDGILNGGSPGPCTNAFPLYSTSRIVAGGNIKGDIFKCHLQSVADAIANGVYDSIVIDGATQIRLEQIFPDGVCDYTKGDMGLPEGW
ncbi:MAG: hypothetical protein IMF02_13200 [Proteobacteria bacterium]|nr:hypothetical protein [Pseudomonadota bacterium]